MTMTTDPPATTAAGQPHRRRGLAVAGAAAAVVASAGLWAVTGNHGHSTPTAAAYDSACGLHGGATGTPTTTPATQWQDFGPTWLPVSAEHGPGVRSANGPWSCFSHTPTGAVLAAFTIPYRTAVAPDFASVVKQQTVSGPGQAALLKQGQTPETSENLIVPVGFHIDGYTGDTATVSFQMLQKGLDFLCTSGVQWSGGPKGDWLLRLQPDGGVLLGCTQEKAFDQPDFVKWGPRQ
jgi:hypothetical protein